MSILLKSCFLLVFLCGLASVVRTEKKIVCYVGTWAAYRDGPGRFETHNIDPFLCTHLMYGFFGINEDGTVRVIDPYLDLEENYGRGYIKKFNSLKLLNPTLKTMAAVGGWNEGSIKFSNVAANPALRQKFIEDCIQFCKKHNFDGVDLDWEYPAQRGGNEAVDKDNHAAWMEEFRSAFDRENLIISAAVASAEFSSGVSYDIPRVSAALHFINVMTYDMHGAWDDYCGLNAPLFEGPADESELQKQLNVNASIQFWISQGGDKEKIIMGIPLYGRTFTLANAAVNHIGAPIIGPGIAGQYTREPGVMAYHEICKEIQTGQWELHSSVEQLGFYATKGNQWIGYDDASSIQYKMDYLLELGLGGVMVWSLENDDFVGICHERKNILMNTIYLAIHHGEEPPTLPPTTTSATSSTTTDPSIPGPWDECSVEGIFPHEEFCEKYYICTNYGIRYDFACPNGLLFDPINKICNWADLVECQSR